MTPTATATYVSPLRAVIAQYRVDHPGDTRTDAAILRSLAECLVERGLMEIRGGIYVLVGSEREAAS